MSVIVHFFEKIVTDDKLYVTIKELNTLTSNNRLESYNDTEILTVESIIKKDYYLYTLINKVSFKANYHSNFQADADPGTNNFSIFDENMNPIQLNDNFNGLSKSSITEYFNDMSDLVLEKDKINNNTRTHSSYKSRSINMIDKKVKNLSTSIITSATDSFMLSQLNKSIFPTFMIDRAADEILTLTEGDKRFMYMFMTSIVEGVTKINEHNEEHNSDLQILATANKSYPLDRAMFFDMLSQIVDLQSAGVTNFGHYGLTTGFSSDTYTDTNDEKFRVIRSILDTNDVNDSIEYYILILNQLLVFIIPLLNGIREQIHKNGLPSFYIYVWAFILCYKNKYNELRELAQMSIKYNTANEQVEQMSAISGGGVFESTDNNTTITYTKIEGTSGKILKNNVTYFVTLSSAIETGDYTLSGTDMSGNAAENLTLDSGSTSVTFSNPYKGEDRSVDDNSTYKYLTFYYYYNLPNPSTSANVVTGQLLHPSLSDSTSKLFNNQIIVK